VAAARLPAWKLRRTAALRSRATRGDEEAFAELYQRHHQALYRYCRSILHHDEDARDALQSTMAKAFAALQHEERDFDLRPWLFRIAHNESISLLRRRRDAAALDSAATLGRDSLPADLESRERLTQLLADLGDLPERQRAALVLRELSGLSHEEIAAVVGGSAGAIKQTIFEARSGLHECAEGRDMACADVQRALSDGDGRVLRGRRIRAHLRECRHCRQFKAALAQRPADLALIAPPLPAAAGAALLAGLVPGAKASAVAGGGAAAAGGAGGAALTTKIAVIVATTATAAGGTVAATEIVRHERAARHASHQTDRAPRQATSPQGRLSLSGRTGSGVSDRAVGPRAGRLTLDGPARRKSQDAVEARSPGAASSPTHHARPERARGGGRPVGSAPPAGSRGRSGTTSPGQARRQSKPAKAAPAHKPSKAHTPAHGTPATSGARGRKPRREKPVATPTPESAGAPAAGAERGKAEK
jgi:RNA polymerase sigma factor (sigma-70 family)